MTVWPYGGALRWGPECFVLLAPQSEGGDKGKCPYGVQGPQHRHHRRNHCSDHDAGCRVPSWIPLSSHRSPQNSQQCPLPGDWAGVDKLPLPCSWSPSFCVHLTHFLLLWLRRHHGCAHTAPLILDGLSVGCYFKGFVNKQTSNSI